MSESAVAPATHPSTRTSATTVLAIVGASVLAGIGLLGMSYWLLTQRWLYFASLIPLVGGAYLLFTSATGPDHA